MKTKRTPISAPALELSGEFQGLDSDDLAVYGIKNAIHGGLPRRTIAEFYAMLLTRRIGPDCQNHAFTITFAAINNEIIKKFPKQNKFGSNLALQAIKKQAWKIVETKIKEK